jgi:hypothetical protein
MELIPSPDNGMTSVCYTHTTGELLTMLGVKVRPWNELTIYHFGARKIKILIFVRIPMIWNMPSGGSKTNKKD